MLTRELHHPTAFRWLLALLLLALVLVFLRFKHTRYSGTAFPNRADTESESSGGAEQGAGVGDVGNVGTKTP
jgi:hypothetical protein